MQTRALADNGGVGEEVKQTDYSRAHRREYRRKVQLCLDVFETMLNQSSFEFERPLTGMEIECNLVDSAYQPAMSNHEVLGVDRRSRPIRPNWAPTTSNSTFRRGRLPGQSRLWSWRRRCGPA